MFDGFFYYGSHKDFDINNGIKYTEGIFSSKIFLEDLSFLRGDAVFEVMEARKLVVFHEDEHLKRLFNSAKEQALFIKGLNDFEVFRGFFKERIQKVLERNGNRNKSCTIRVMITGGITWDEFRSNGPSVFIMTKPFKEPQFNVLGLKILPVQYQREFPEIKSINYQMAERILRQNPGFDDILYLKEGHNGKREINHAWHDLVLEASRSNFFWVIDNKIITPKDGVLQGVTRKILIELAEMAGYTAEEKEITWGNLALRGRKPGDNGEVFLTNTTFFVNPICQIGETKFLVGPVTKTLWGMFTGYREWYYEELELLKK